VKRDRPNPNSVTRRILKQVTRRILPYGWTGENPKSKIQNPKWAVPFAPAIGTGILLTLAYPNWNLDFLAWVALMPLTYGLLRFPESAFRQGFVAGVVFFWSTTYWLWHVTAAGWLSLGTYLALYPAIWAWGMSRFRKLFPENSGLHHLRLALFGAASWVALEWIRSHFLTGFGWNALGVSQFRNLPLIQIAEITGVYGVSFVVVFFNVAFFCGVRRMVLEKFSMARWRYEITASLVLLVLVVVWGMRSYQAQARLPIAKTFRVALVQPNVPQTLKWDDEADKQARRDLRMLTLDAAAAKPDLIVWPETALTSGPGFDTASAGLVQDLIKTGKTPMLIGTLERDPFEPRLYFNAALLVSPDTAETAYHKRHLVPFGEFVPFDKTFPALKKLTPIGENFGTGKGAQLLKAGGGNVQIGTLICFEDIFSEVARESARAGADVLVNITNDGWFKESHQQRQHAANAAFRAVENRLPLVRCCNNGYTCVIDPTGKVSASLEDAEHNIYIQGIKIAELELRDRPQAFYTRYGDVFAILCAVFTALFWSAWTVQAIRTSRHS